MVINESCVFDNKTSDEIIDILKKETLDTYPQDGINIIIPSPNNYSFQLTSSLNELSSLHFLNNNNLMSIIDLNDCETLLKQKYDIPENYSLIILKYEKLTGNASEKSIQYEIYSPINYTLLNLSICQNEDIDINIAIPVKVEEEIEDLYYDLKDQGYDLLDRYNKFYIDICTPFTAENGADVLLIDRLYYFFTKVDYLTVCPSNCQYSSFSMENKYLSCKCGVDNDNIDVVNSNKNFGELSYNLSDYELKYTSYKTMKCYKLVFSFKHFIKNGGSIILYILILAYIAFIIYYLIKGISPLKTALSKILFDNKDIDNKFNPFFEVNSINTKNTKNTKITKSTKNIKKAKSTKSEKSEKNAKSVKSSKPTKNKLRLLNTRSVKGDNPPRRSLKNTLKIKAGNKDRLIDNKIQAFNLRNINNINTENEFLDLQTKEDLKKEDKGEFKLNNKTTQNIKNDYNQNNQKTIQINAGATKSFYLNFGNRFKPKKENSEIGDERTKNNKSKFRRKLNSSDEDKSKKVKFKNALESNSSLVEVPLPKKEDPVLDDYELNHLGYLAAIKLDKRNCGQIYCSLLNRDQIIRSTCFACNDYNLFYVKILKLIFVIANLMAMNAFLFADKSFHKLFMSGVHYYFSYQILQIILSVIITYFVETFLCYITYTDRYIYEIKIFYKNEKNNDRIFKILRYIRIKLITFFIISFIILLFYWYFVSAFCAVYPNTQKIYLLDCTISFLIFCAIPFVVYAIITILRIIAIQDRDKKRCKCLYKISRAIPIF